MVVTLNSPRLRVTAVLGKTGFIISSIRDLLYDKEWLYSGNGVLEDRSLIRTFDEQYAGGMEFLFPSDEAEAYEGNFYQDHGFAWRLPYEILTWETDGEEAKKPELKVQGLDTQTGIRIGCHVKLAGDTILLSLDIENMSCAPLPYLARLHPAFLLDADTELLVYGKELIFEEDLKYCSFPPDEPPDAGRPPSWKEYDMFYHVRQEKGEFSVTDQDRKIRFQYDNHKLPYLTVCSYRKDGRRIGILEPANAAGASLAGAAGRGTVPELMPGELIRYDFKILPE